MEATFYTPLQQEEAAVRSFASLVLRTAVAIIATLLAGIGVFGVALRSITSRRREMGIRVAVGAEPARLLREELVRESVPLALGIAAGLGLTIAATRLMAGFLFGVGPLDPLSFVAAITALALVGVLATFAAARRLLGLDPSEVLRAD